MAFEIRKHHNNKATEVYVGPYTLLFSYETLVGITIPSIGRIRRENVWGPTTGKHLNSWRSRYVVRTDTFKAIEFELDRTLGGYGTSEGLIARVEIILLRAGAEVL